MESNETRINQILAFLQNRLSPEDHASFLKEVDGDQLLQKDVEAYKKIMDRFQEKRLEKYQNRIAILEKQLPPVDLEEEAEAAILKSLPTFESAIAAQETLEPVADPINLDRLPNKSTRKSMVRISLALVVLSLLALIAWFWFGKRVDAVGLVRGQYELPELTLKGTQSPSIDYIMGVRSFRMGKHEDAMTQLGKVADESFEYISTQYVLGHIAMFEGRYKEAISHFEIIRKEINFLAIAHVRENALAPANEEDVQWYMSLAYLGDEQIKKSKEILQTIVDNEVHAYHQKAVALLRAL